jgi:hypothetical protein
MLTAVAVGDALVSNLVETHQQRLAAPAAVHAEGVLADEQDVSDAAWGCWRPELL